MLLLIELKVTKEKDKRKKTRKITKINEWNKRKRTKEGLQKK